MAPIIHTCRRMKAILNTMKICASPAGRKKLLLRVEAGSRSGLPAPINCQTFRAKSSKMFFLIDNLPKLRYFLKQFSRGHGSTKS